MQAPIAAERVRMQVLIVLGHPDPDSFAAALAQAAAHGARAAGHVVDLLDLAAEGFDPRMTAAEWRGQAEAPADPALVRMTERLAAAEAVVFVHPTWWGGPPATVKGWIDRVWRPGVAYAADPATGRLRPGLTRARVLGVVTTLGMPWWAWVLTGAPGRRMILRSLRPCLPRGARTFWLALHVIDRTTPLDRARFIARVAARMGRLG